MTIYRRPDGRVFELADSGAADACRLCPFTGNARECDDAPMECTLYTTTHWRELVQAPPAPRLLVDRLWAALQAAGLTATETRQYIRNLKSAAGGEHALGTLLPRGGDGFIRCGFTWHNSPEGYDYWNAVACRLDTRVGQERR